MTAAAERDDRATIIAIDAVSKIFGRDTLAVDDVSIDIREGEFFALLGPSGCGKTTLLRMIAGFESVTEGRITLDGKDMAGVPPNRRPVNMVFQSYAVFPHMTVHDNVTYGLRVDGVPKAQRDARASEALALVRLDAFSARKPDQLSGGQRQRVALARALVKRPRVLLLDEPLSALDAKLRESMQMELVQLQHRVGITFVVVTHDQDEALSMADRIAVMEHGAVRQLAPPNVLYEHPNCRFVADFIGKTNMFEGRVRVADGSHLEVQAEGLGTLRLPAQLVAEEDVARCQPGASVGIAVRPEKVELTDNPSEQGLPGVDAEVLGIAYHGAQSLVFLRLAGGETMTANVQNRERSGRGLREGDRCHARWRPEDTLVLTR